MGKGARRRCSGGIQTSLQDVESKWSFNSNKITVPTPGIISKAFNLCNQNLC